MEKKFRVILLIEEKPESFVARIHRGYAQNRGDALLDALALYASMGADLGRVKNSRVTEVVGSKTLLGLNAI